MGVNILGWIFRHLKGGLGGFQRNLGLFFGLLRRFHFLKDWRNFFRLLHFPKLHLLRIRLLIVRYLDPFPLRSTNCLVGCFLRNCRFLSDIVFK